MRVTSVIILLESERQNVFTLLYRKLRDYSNILLTAVNLYEAWNKPEEAEMWHSKLPQIETLRKWHCNNKMAQLSLVKFLQPRYNYTTPYLPIFGSTQLVSVLHKRAYGGIKIDNVFNAPCQLESDID